ncbi:unnamed protein product, partial [Ascophyllum nodosum]
AVYIVFQRKLKRHSGGGRVTNDVHHSKQRAGRKELQRCIWCLFTEFLPLSATTSNLRRPTAIGDRFFRTMPESR